MTVTKDQAIQAMRDLPGDREESERTLGVYLDQSVDAAFERAFGTPLTPREDCPNCGGRGYTGRHTHDPQQSTADDCEWCDGVGWVPPPEPPSSETPRKER